MRGERNMSNDAVSLLQHNGSTKKLQAFSLLCLVRQIDECSPTKYGKQSVLRHAKTFRIMHYTQKVGRPFSESAQGQDFVARFLVRTSVPNHSQNILTAPYQIPPRLRNTTL